MTITLRLPVLESGDRLSRDEFHRRYCELPNLRAELVEGVVYVSSPVRQELQGRPHMQIVTWAGTYVAQHEGVDASVDATVLLNADTEVQPDLFLFRVPAAGGSARMNENGYIEGPPQLVIEIVASSASYDLHDKLQAYQAAGVHEYVVWRTLDEQVDWFRLLDGRYVRIQPGPNGVIERDQFHGLRLNVPKLLAGDMTAVLAELAPPG
jgi:Uma2 family endonuclease